MNSACLRRPACLPYATRDEGDLRSRRVAEDHEGGPMEWMAVAGIAQDAELRIAAEPRIEAVFPEQRRQLRPL